MSKHTTNATTYKIYKPLISLMVIIEINSKKYCSPNESENFEKCIQFYDMFVNRMHELLVKFFYKNFYKTHK